MSKGRFLQYGGQYAPETMMAALEELEQAYEKYSRDPEFRRELTDLLKNYAGRLSFLYYAEKMTKDLDGAKIYLKREDLNHTGSHKINNVLGRYSWQKNGKNESYCGDRGRSAWGGNRYGGSSYGYGM